MMVSLRRHSRPETFRSVTGPEWPRTSSSVVVMFAIRLCPLRLNRLLRSKDSSTSSETRNRCYDQLRSVLRQIYQHHQMNYTGKPKVVLLGDYIDRGPKSREVINLFVVRNVWSDLIDFIFIRGNHDEELLILYDEMLKDGIPPDIGIESFLSNGGDATMMSYGYPGEKICFNQFLQNIPHEHLDFLRSTRWSYEHGPYFFVHAGIDPDRHILDQDPKTFIEIREKFLTSEKIFGRIVVHGHTESSTVTVLSNRIGVDTGAGYPDGHLSGVCLDGSVTIFSSKTTTSELDEVIESRKRG
ncbi:unnamed protein product [Sphagnum balticum]